MEKIFFLRIDETNEDDKKFINALAIQGSKMVSRLGNGLVVYRTEFDDSEEAEALDFEREAGARIFGRGIYSAGDILIKEGDRERKEFTFIEFDFFLREDNQIELLCKVEGEGGSELVTKNSLRCLRRAEAG